MNPRIKFLVLENIKTVKEYLQLVDVQNNYSENVDFKVVANMFKNIRMKDTSVNKVNTDLLYLFTYRCNETTFYNGLYSCANNVQENIGINDFVTSYYNSKLFKKTKQGYFNKYDYTVIEDLEKIFGESTLADAYFNSNVNVLLNKYDNDTVKNEIMFLMSILDVYYFTFKEMQTHPFKSKKYLNKVDVLKKLIYVSIDSIKEEINNKSLKKEIF